MVTLSKEIEEDINKNAIESIEASIDANTFEKNADHSFSVITTLNTDYNTNTAICIELRTHTYMYVEFFLWFHTNNLTHKRMKFHDFQIKSISMHPRISFPFDSFFISSSIFHYSKKIPLQYLPHTHIHKEWARNFLF